MKKYLPAVVVMILIIGFFGFIIYMDQKNSREIAQKMGQTPTTAPSADSAESSENTEQPMNTSGAKSLPKPSVTIDKNKTYTAVLKTDKGDITIALTAKETPVTVNNFVYLARQKFYDNTIFHRTIKDFMIQGGDPTGTGAGGPGYRFDDEPFSGSYKRGTVAMANAGPNTNGSQFFIMHAAQSLPPNYVIFGNVTDGLQVLDAIATAEVTTNEMGEPSKPVTPVIIKSVEITEQ